MTKELLESRVTEAVVRAEPRPKFTETWRPFSHGEVLDAVGQSCKDFKLDIVNREYSIRRNSKMFAVWEIAGKDKEFNLAIGIRNSIDKTHSVGLCACEKIFVCSNFVFQSEYEWVLFRKHTGQLELGEITYLANEALKALMPKFDQLKNWHQAMKELKLSNEQASMLMVAAMKRDIIPPAKFPTFHDLYAGAERKYSKYDNTLYAFHGAATELMNPNNILTQTWKQNQLNYFIDYEVPTILKHSNRKDIVLDLKAIEIEGFKKYKVDRAKKKAEMRKVSAQIKETFKEKKKAEKTKAKEKVQPKKKVQAKKHIVSKKAFDLAMKKQGAVKLDCGLKLKVDKS